MKKIFLNILLLIMVVGLHGCLNTLVITGEDTGYVGETITLEVNTEEEVMWESSDDALATVLDGEVSLLQSGTVTIKVWLVSNENKYKTIDITILPVENISVTSITIDSQPKNIVVGDEIELMVSILPSNAFNKTYQVTSSNLEIASVEENKVTFIKDGTVTIKVVSNEDENIFDEITINVNPVPIYIVISGDSEGEVGDSITLSSLVYPFNTIQDVIWETSDSTIATVQDGKVDLLSAGTVKITATSVINSGVTKEITINVKGQSSYEEFDLQIVTVNDLHGYISVSDSGVENSMAKMSYLINQIREENTLDDVVLIGNGDMLQGTAISNIFRGLSVIEAMNVMEFDVMGIGNHEFDWGFDTFLDYFDGDEANGEANFPLLNANVYYRDTNKLVTIDNGNVLESIIIQKEHINVGIISYIGNVYNSINASLVQNYYFDNDISSSVKKIGTSLKEQGADVIIVNIHGGDYNITSYEPNVALANLKYNNSYLVDAVINGHTHNYQNSYITRSNGVRLPVIQCDDYGSHFGVIKLTIDENKKVTAANNQIVSIDTAGSNSDPNVEKVLEKYNEQLDELNEDVYTTSGEDVSYASTLYEWVENVLISSTNAICAVTNKGGIRSGGNIEKGKDINISNLIEINPFDNKLIMVPIKGNDLYNYLQENESYNLYQTKATISLNNLRNSDEYVLLAIIDYVYYGAYFDFKTPGAYETDLIMRDILIADLRQKGKNNETFMPVLHPEASIDVLEEYYIVEFYNQNREIEYVEVVKEGNSATYTNNNYSGWSTDVSNVQEDLKVYPVLSNINYINCEVTMYKNLLFKRKDA